MHESLVRPLFPNPLDIVADAHGEIDALNDLLGHLGYRPDGTHPEGRRLVFLGDLTDRGPDSPAVVALVKQFVDAGLSQCVLGNHDLNILLGEQKYDNAWFHGKDFSSTASWSRRPWFTTTRHASRSRISFVAFRWCWKGPTSG